MNSLYPWFKLDSLSSFIAGAVVFFSFLIIAYSLRFMKGKARLVYYYAYVVLTLIASLGAVFTNNLILLLVFWGFLGLTLYLLMNVDTRDASIASKKTFIIIGGSDALMLLGIGILYHVTGTFQMDKISVALGTGAPAMSLKYAAYICLAIACFAKAGAMPFHTWIPDCSKDAPVPVVAYLPASLDKLLGIYLLTRMSLELFVMDNAMNMLLMVIGAVTIIGGVMMAMVQHNMKKLLGYHAVSQVGYMILGIGTATPVGIAGGLFHMLNNALYKSSLFLAAGNVEYRAKTTELDELGGLAKVMPFTYIAALIASLSISGIPPFNGFVSKWMVYQGVVNRLGVVGTLCLAAAMFGSGLTLASFIKLLYSVFLGQKRSDAVRKGMQEVSWIMWLPPLLLSVICVIFGVFARQLPLKYFIYPAVGEKVVTGTWLASTATALIVLGLIVGLLIARLKLVKPVMRTGETFTGGEDIDYGDSAVKGTEFYNTVKEYGILRFLYGKAEKGLFDIYEQGKNLVFGTGRFFQYLHNGVLPTYLVWTLLGMIGLFIILMR